MGLEKQGLIPLLRKLGKLHDLAYREHVLCEEDDYYSCVSLVGYGGNDDSRECDCGAGIHNAEADKLYQEILDTL